MKKLSFLIIAISLLGLFACKPSSRSKPSDKWSVRMANTVIEQYDSLVNYQNSNESKRWQYDVAMLGGAIDKLGYLDPQYSEYMKSYIDRFVQENGTILTYRLESYNIDNINPGKNLLTLYKRTGEEKYKRAFEQLVDQMRIHPKTASDGYWHKNIYPNQLWLDGIYMASPFLAQYAKEYNAPEWFDVVTHQIVNIYGKTLDPNTKLLYHACDESRQMAWSNPETGHSPHFWSRAMGWYLMAIVDVLDYLPETHNQRDTILDIFQTTIEALLNVCDTETGLWCQVLDQCSRDGNYVEASGSIMYTYAMAKAANKGYIPIKYLDIANEKFDAVVKHLIDIEENGHLSLRNTCGGCGLGGNPYRDGSFEYYTTERIVVNDTKGIGPFILAAIELDR
jgi:unsaturated rhamnogalacturonyl hydrolase